MTFSRHLILGIIRWLNGRGQRVYGPFVCLKLSTGMFSFKNEIKRVLPSLNFISFGRSMNVARFWPQYFANWLVQKTSEICTKLL